MRKVACTASICAAAGLCLQTAGCSCGGDGDDHGRDAATDAAAPNDASPDGSAPDTGSAPDAGADQCQPFDFGEAIDNREIFATLVRTAGTATELGRTCDYLRLADFAASLQTDVSALIPDGAGTHQWNGTSYPASAVWESRPGAAGVLSHAQGSGPVSMHGLAFLKAAGVALAAGDPTRAGAFIGAAVRTAVLLDAGASTSTVEVAGMTLTRRAYPRQLDFDPDGNGEADSAPRPSGRTNPNDWFWIQEAAFVSNLWAVTNDSRWGDAAKELVVDFIASLGPYGENDEALAYYPLDGGDANSAPCNGTAQVTAIVSKALGEDELYLPFEIPIPLTDGEREYLRTEVLGKLIRFFALAAQREAVAGGEGCSWIQTEETNGGGGLVGSRSATLGGGSAGIAAVLASAHAVLGDGESAELVSCAARWARSRAIPDPDFGGTRWLLIEPPCPACDSAEARALVESEDVTVDGETVQTGMSKTAHCRGVAGITHTLADAALELGPSDPDRAEAVAAVAGGLEWVRAIAMAGSGTDALGGLLLPGGNLGGNRIPRMGPQASAVEQVRASERLLADECAGAGGEACDLADEAHELRGALFDRLFAELRCQDTLEDRISLTAFARAADCSEVTFPWM
ncbi:MAG: hypothetical protein HYY06_14110 [Deltaproteobacteria bacterium]|nr:hypothetical protein [Deltaproteobacteria bacterium]